MIGLHMGFQDGGDLRALGLGGRDVVRSQVGVGVDRELARGLAAEQVGGAAVPSLRNWRKYIGLMFYQEFD